MVGRVVKTQRDSLSMSFESRQGVMLHMLEKSTLMWVLGFRLGRGSSSAAESGARLHHLSLHGRSHLHPLKQLIHSRTLRKENIGIDVKTTVSLVLQESDLWDLQEAVSNDERTALPQFRKPAFSTKFLHPLSQVFNFDSASFPFSSFKRVLQETILHSCCCCSLQPLRVGIRITKPERCVPWLHIFIGIR
jgi:hypothetical protein